MAKKTAYSLNGGYLYMVTCGKFVKVGFAKNPAGRFVTLQSGCPYLMKLTIYKVPDSSSRYALELWCQFKLKEYWTGNGEWFETSHQRVSSIIQPRHGTSSKARNKRLDAE